MTSISPAPKPKPSPRKAPSKVYSSIKQPSWEDVCLELAKARAKRKPIKKRNPKRAAANHERACGEHADFIRSLPCCVCGYQGPAVEAAHTKTGGTGRKSDAKWLAPMCGDRAIHTYGLGVGFIEGCHPRSHRIGVKTFERAHDIDLKAIALELWAKRTSEANA